MTAPDISVVLPMYNEAEMVDRCLAAVTAEMERLGRAFEIVCVNDGSVDRTAELLDAAAARDARVVPVHFARNFGKEAALSAGLEAARGAAVLFMDADLQHPPDLIPQMVARWDEGFDVIDAVKADRGRENPLYRAFAHIFYALMGGAVGQNLRGASDFKLLDRQVVDALLRMPERNRFFRGLVAWVGFRVARVPFQVREREAGTSKWNVRSLVSYSIRNLVAFSAVPLKVVAWLGFATVGLGVVLAAQTLWNWWSGIAVDGFTTVILLMLFLCGLILVSIGVVAYYVAYLYEEQKARPLYVVRRHRERVAGAEARQRPGVR